VAVFLDPGTGPEDDGCQALVPQGLQAGFDGFVIVGHDRIPAGGLIASGDKAVQRDRVVFGGDALLLKKCTQDARFNGGEFDFHRRCFGREILTQRRKERKGEIVCSGVYDRRGARRRCKTGGESAASPVGFSFDAHRATLQKKRRVSPALFQHNL